MALHEIPAKSRPHRNFYPQLLRRSAGRSRAPQIPGKTKAAAEAGGQGDLERALRGYPQLRALSDKERCDRTEILSSRFKEGAKTTVPGTDRRSAEELEILLQRRGRARLLG